MISPTTATHSPRITKEINLINAGFRPFSLEELALIPTACVYNPRFVYFSANAVSSTQISIMNTGVGIGIPGINPPYIPKDSSLITGSSLLLIHAAMERPAVNKISVAIVGLIKVSRLSSINYSVIAKDIEMDAILAVALGGNSLSGGKFNMTSSILGAYVIQFLTTTLYKFNVESAALSAYKAVVVIALVVFSAPAVRKKFADLTKKMKPQAKEAV